MDVGVHRWLPLQSLPSLSVMQIYGYGRRPPSESALKVVFMLPMIAGEGGQRPIKAAGVQKRRRRVSASTFGARRKRPYSAASVSVHELRAAGDTLCLIYLSYSFISEKDIWPSSLVVLFSHFLSSG